jgi:hypothetical protein
MTTPTSNRPAIPQEPGSWRDNTLPLVLRLAFGLILVIIALLVGWLTFVSGGPTQ